MIKPISILLKSKSLVTVFLSSAITLVHGQSLPSFELSSEWKEKIESMVSDQKKHMLKRRKNY